MSKIVLFLLATAAVAWCGESHGYSGHSQGITSTVTPRTFSDTSDYTGDMAAFLAFMGSTYPVGNGGQASSDSSLLDVHGDTWKEDTVAVLVEGKEDDPALKGAWNASYDVVAEFKHWYSNQLANDFHFEAGKGWVDVLPHVDRACKGTYATTKSWSKGWSPFPDLSTGLTQVTVSWDQYQKGNYWYFGGQACGEGFDRYTTRIAGLDLDSIDYAVPTMPDFCNGRGVKNATAYLPKALSVAPFGAAEFKCCKAGTGRCSLKKVCTSATSRDCIGL